MKLRITAAILAGLVSAQSTLSAQESILDLVGSNSESIVETPSPLSNASEITSLLNAAEPEQTTTPKTTQETTVATEVSVVPEIAADKGEMVQQRFPTGKVHVERWVSENREGDLVNHGTYVQYNEQGHVVVSGRYELGQRIGEWSKQLSAEETKQLTGSALIGFTPPFISKAEFVDGELHGDWACSDSKGKLVFVWTFEDGKRNGPSTMFNAKGEVSRSINYDNNKADGPAKVALKADQAPQDIQFEDGRMLRRIDRHYPGTVANGRKQLKSQDWYLVPTPYNIDGNDWETNRVNYSQVDKGDMIRHGRSVTYFENGQRESDGQYEYGKKQGTFVWWYSNGQQKTLGEYKNDKEEGKWSWWHQNGMREAAGTFAAGNKVDQWSVWSPEGKLVKRARPSSAAQIATKPSDQEIK